MAILAILMNLDFAGGSGGGVVVYEVPYLEVQAAQAGSRRVQAAVVRLHSTDVLEVRDRDLIVVHREHTASQVEVRDHDVQQTSITPRAP